VDLGLEAGGRLGSGEERVQEAGKNRLSFFVLMFLTSPKIQADGRIFNTHFYAEFKSNQSTQKHVKERLRRHAQHMFQCIKE
jgi:hypothetical protein